MALSKRPISPVESSSKRNQAKTRYMKKNEAKHGQESKGGQFWTVPRTIFIICMFFGISVVYRNHLATMFENDRHFSHLSTQERELAFRTEMGLYYSYFKTIISAKSCIEGLQTVMSDNITEYPSTINTLKRFNLYPEVVLGLAFRVYEQVSDFMKWQTMVCYTVNRGQGYEPVKSCEGLGEPAYFYVESIYWLNGFMMGIFFLLGTYLSYDSSLKIGGSPSSFLLGCPFGGVITVAAFFFNQGEATRVQWTPPLRESFAYPFFVMEVLVVTYMLRSRNTSFAVSAAIAVLTTTFMACWQFAQFALLTQTVAVFGAFALQYASAEQMKTFLIGQTMGFVGGFILLFGNEMLLTSFYVSCLVTIWVILLVDPVLEKLNYRVLRWVTQGLALATGTLGIKILFSKLLRVADDEHIGEIFRSKFTNFQNFHTMLYTCAKEFDFLEVETINKLIMTLLLPSAALAVFLVLFQIVKYELWHNKGERKTPQETADNGPSSKPSPELVYHVLQLVAFTAMAILVMRLKLFWTPQLCIVSAFLASRKLVKFIPRYNEGVHSAVLVLLVASMGVAGYSNLKHQRSIVGEFSNYPMEELVDWIKTKTPKDAVFAGPMPTMATVKLVTNRPIVNHPHYEDAGLRARTKKVYSMYSRKPASEVQHNLLDLGVQYAILEDSWCTRQSRPGCSMPDIWDIEDAENRGKPAVCLLLRNNPEPHFKRVFQNSVYEVLELVKS